MDRNGQRNSKACLIGRLASFPLAVLARAIFKAGPTRVSRDSCICHTND